MNRIALIGIIMTLSSCITLTYYESSTKGVEYPDLDAKPLGHTYRRRDPQSLLTTQDVERLWGPPVEKQVMLHDREEWIYKGKLGWSGVFMVAIFLPIPLMIPTGHESTILSFKSGRLDYAIYTKYTNADKDICSPIPFPFQDNVSEFMYPCLRF